MSLEIRLLSYKGNGTQGERIVRTTFRGKIESTVCYTRHITALILDISINERVLTEKKRLDLNMYLAEKNFISLFDKLGWCLRFPTNKYQVENPKVISGFDVAAVRKLIWTFYIS